jgi:anti-sigma factor RsiW
MSSRDWLEHRWTTRQMSAYVDGGLSDEEHVRFERHADLCLECGPLRRTLVRLAVELRALPRPPERSIAPDVVEWWRAAERDRAASELGGGDGR